MKRFKLLLLTSALLMTSIAVNAEEYYYHPDGYEFELREDGTAVLTSSYCTESEQTIPDEIFVKDKEYLVTEIGKFAYMQDEFLVTLNLGNNIQKIDTDAFFSCPYITTLVAGEHLKEIESEAFYICTSLKNIYFNDQLEKLEPGAFSSCGTLTEVTLPTSLYDLKANPFQNCYRLTEIKLKGESQYLAVEDGMLLSKDRKYLYCVPQYINTPDLNIPEGVEIMVDNSARALSRVTSLLLPSSLKEIGNFALQNNFYTSLNIPANVEKIGMGNLVMCESLKELTVESANAYFKSDGKLLLSKDGKKIYASLIQSGDLVIPDGVEEIDGYTFIYMQEISSVKSPNTLKKIGNSAFAACYYLGDVELGTSLEELGRECFSGDISITKIELPATLKIIGNQAFTECDNLQGVYIPDGVVEIGPFAFFGCNQIKEVRVPGTIEKWGEYSFYLCPKMEKAIIEEGVTFLGERAFAFCDNLYDVTLPSTLRYISEEAFIMTSLAELEWPEQLETIGDYAFQYCKFKDIVLPDGVTSIGKNSFSWMDNLISFTAGGNLEYIGENAFNRNFSMTDLYMNAVTPPTVETELFAIEEFNGYKTVSLHVPDVSTQDYRTAPIWQKFTNISGDISGIESIESASDPTIVKIYGIDGTIRTEMEKGINIVVYNDGTIKKIIN